MMRCRLVFMSVLLLASAALAVAQDPAVRQIEAAEQAFEVARSKGDEDFTWITRTGSVTHKPQHVAELVSESPSQRISRQIKIYGDTAFVGTSVLRGPQEEPVNI